MCILASSQSRSFSIWLKNWADPILTALAWVSPLQPVDVLASAVVGVWPAQTLN